jgi:hypothetical protein
MPEEYSGDNISDNYKFMAIPYVASDKPSYGSKFTDIYLTYFLTLLCYMYKNKNNKIRQIDKNEILNYYLLSSTTNNDTAILNLFPDNIKNDSFLHNIKTKPELYYGYIKNDLIITPNIYIHILEKNKSYSQLAQNISFTDLLLNNNVSKYISFTGTAYINLPIDINKNYSKYMSIKRQTIGKYNNTEEIIKYIIDERIVNFYKNSNTETINNIKNCLLRKNPKQDKPKYNVLIDIGAFFIMYNNNEFIEWFKEMNQQNGNQYKYLLYYHDDIPHIIDLILDTEIDIESYVDEDKTTFIYFSNKYITGIDAKKYMPKDLHGLVTVAINTNLRDFAQGVYRMRDIAETQTIDIIMQEEIHQSYKSCENNEEHKNASKNCSKYDSIRNYLYMLLLSNNNIIENNKINMLYKQNILALQKLRLNIKLNKYTHYLYIDPLKYNDVNYFPVDERIYHSSLKDDLINIDLLNINKHQLTVQEDIRNECINELFDEYRNNISSCPSISENQNENQQKDKTNNEPRYEIDRCTRIIYSINNTEDIQHIKYYPHNMTNKIYIHILNNDIYYNDLIIVYNKRSNIIFIFDFANFNYFVNQHLEKHLFLGDYVAISLYTYKLYKFNTDQINDNVNIIDDSVKEYIIIYAKELLSGLYSNILIFQKQTNERNIKIKMFNLNSIEKKIKETDEYKKFINIYNNIHIVIYNSSQKKYINWKYIKNEDEPLYITQKYKKYKAKYLKLKQLK